MSLIFTRFDAGKLRQDCTQQNKAYHIEVSQVAITNYSNSSRNSQTGKTPHFFQKKSQVLQVRWQRVSDCVPHQCNAHEEGDVQLSSTVTVIKLFKPSCSLCLCYYIFEQMVNFSFVLIIEACLKGSSPQRTSVLVWSICWINIWRTDHIKEWTPAFPILESRY